MGNNRTPYSRLKGRKRNFLKKKVVQIAEVLGESSGVAGTNSSKDKHFATGRRIVDIALWFKQIANLASHSSVNCCNSDIEVISEKLEGLRSGFTVKCKKCHYQSVLWTDDPETAGGKLDINLAADQWIITSGGSHSKLEELCGSLKIPCLAHISSSAPEKHHSGLLHATPVGEKEVACSNSGVPPVAEPVQVFLDVSTAQVESSLGAQVEVDPFQDVDRPLDGDWGKGRGNKPLKPEEPDIAREGGSKDISDPPRCNDQTHEFVAYSLQSDVVISNEDGDEKPAIAVKSFCCSLENCHRMFDSWDELNTHQRSSHLSVTGMHDFASGENSNLGVQTSESGILNCGESLSDSIQKSSKRKWSAVEDVSNKSATASSAVEMGVRQAQDPLEYANDNSVRDSDVLSGDSSQCLEASSDAGAVVKVESAEDIQQDTPCIAANLSCNHCSHTFQMELSLKKHMSEKHSKSDGVSALGGDGGPRPEADGKMDTSIAVQGGTLAKEVGGNIGKISIVRDLYVEGSTLSPQWQANTETASEVVNHCGIRVASLAGLGDQMGSQIGLMSSNGTVCNQRFTSKIFSVGHEVARSEKSFFGCEMCGRLFEVDGDAQPERAKNGTARLCQPCMKKSKPASGVNDLRKNPRLHQCNKCGQTYLMKSVLKRHERVHTGERPFVCSICGRTYTRSEYLKDHMKVHDLKEESLSTS